MGESTVNAPAQLLDKAKAAAESKNLGQVIAAGKEWLRYLVLSAHQFAEKMEAAGETIEGADKKAMVIAAAQEQFTPLINQAIDIPFLNEETEAKVINKGIEIFISKTIDVVVMELKKVGWVIK